MIRSFSSKALERFAATGDKAKLSAQNSERIRRILLALNEAKSPNAMNLPDLKFHLLKGRRRRAVWVAANRRITFGWDDKDAVDVDLKDYH
jgi:plasmid maintenance system killer protein